MHDFKKQNYSNANTISKKCILAQKRFLATIERLEGGAEADATEADAAEKVFGDKELSELNTQKGKQFSPFVL